ncbi:ATP binding protein [Aureococcus anophagefferens]|nr:ATP binding protein [Aureococcus anophagefferens]
MAALISRTSALRPLLRAAMHRRAFAAPATTVRSEAPLSTTFPAKIEERREVSVLGLPLAAVDVLLAKGGALFDGLDDGVTGVERDAFLELLENEVAMRGVSKYGAALVADNMTPARVLAVLGALRADGWRVLSSDVYHQPDPPYIGAERQRAPAPAPTPPPVPAALKAQLAEAATRTRPRTPATPRRRRRRRSAGLGRNFMETLREGKRKEAEDKAKMLAAMTPEDRDKFLAAEEAADAHDKQEQAPASCGGKHANRLASTFKSSGASLSFRRGGAGGRGGRGRGGRGAAASPSSSFLGGGP